MPDNDSSDNDRIVRCAIRPAIGVARVGNAAPDDYDLAPEIPGRPSGGGGKPKGIAWSRSGTLRRSGA
jgi:hypothetical protein